MQEYINPNPYAVHLLDQYGKIKKMKSGEKDFLSDFFAQYAKKGLIKPVSATKSTELFAAKPHVIQGRIQLNQNKSRVRIAPSQPIQLQSTVPAKSAQRQIVQKQIRKNISLTKEKKIVGKTINSNATKSLHDNLNNNNYPISDEIGIGILSYNRPNTLKRLISSIIRYTDLRKTTIFISDDNSDNQELIDYLSILSMDNNFVVIKNETRLGIAGNSNRLLRCLKRFKYGILLNDDVEILASNWEDFYVNAMQKTNFHHFIFRQPGIYGATKGTNVSVNGCNLEVVYDKPHGAVLAFDHHVIDKIGYFDEGYGIYGMEHVDWSQRVSDFSLQDVGFFDVTGSQQYFKLHSDLSSIDHDRTKLLKAARERFANRIIQKILPSELSIVPSVTYIVPFRNYCRLESILTIINNIRAQKFPEIEIIMVEQDINNNINVESFQPVNYHKISNPKSDLFNKSMAFNFGVSHATTDYLILHDADIMIQSHYTKTVYNKLKTYESCHLGKSVIYADTESTELINTARIVDQGIKCDRAVNYFEGGSIACRKQTFWKIGAFNEDFNGYGNEDCDFYARLSGLSNWLEDRTFDFLHLWHPRVQGWDQHHDVNKKIEQRLRENSLNARLQLQRQQLLKLGYQRFLVD